MPKPVYRAAHAAIRFVGPELEPADVTNALLLPPDLQHRAGEALVRWHKSGTPEHDGTHIRGQWSMWTRGRVDGPLRTHLDWLLRLLEPRADAIAAILEAGVDADLFCYSLGATPTPPPVPSAIRRRACALGIRIDIDHYEVDDDW